MGALVNVLQTLDTIAARQYGIITSSKHDRHNIDDALERKKCLGYKYCRKPPQTDSNLLIISITLEIFKTHPLI